MEWVTLSVCDVKISGGEVFSLDPEEVFKIVVTEDLAAKMIGHINQIDPKGRLVIPLYFSREIPDYPRLPLSLDVVIGRDINNIGWADSALQIYKQASTLRTLFEAIPLSSTIEKAAPEEDLAVLGVSFITKVGKDYFSKRPQVYDFLFPREIAEKMIGNLCEIVGYSNYVLPVALDEGDKSDLRVRKNVKIIEPIEEVDWASDPLTYTTVRRAKLLNNSLIEKSTLSPELLGIQTRNPDGTLINNFNNEKENTIMNIPSMPSMTFGPYTNSKVSLSFYGLAVQNSNTQRWMSYKSGESYDVTDFILSDMKGMIFAMPVSVNKIAVSDIILHNNVPMVVQSIDSEANTLTAVDVSNSEVKTIIPAKNPLGFNFYTKLVSMFDEAMLGGGENGVSDIFDGNPLMLAMMFGGMGNGSENGNMNGLMQMMFMSKMMKNL